MKLLVLSCGTRNKLVQYFKDNNGFDYVIGADCSDYAPALYDADSFFIIPRMDDPLYFQSVADICNREGVDAILPLQEDELILLSDNRAVLEELFDHKVTIILSDADVVRLCRDKLSFSGFMKDKGLGAVETFGTDEFEECIDRFGKVVIKPRNGAGSVDTCIVDDKAYGRAILDHFKDEEDMIIQPFISGIEYGVDVYVDMISGKAVTAFIKQKVRMRSGETEKSVSVLNKDIEELAVKTAEALGARGPIDMDVMEADGQYMVLEVNPRFGGGYPHAYECGVRFPRLIANNLNGNKNVADFGSYREGVKAMKYSDVIIRNS